FNVDPMSSVVAQMKQGRIQVLDEIVLRHATTEEACLRFQESFGKHAGEIVVYGDASGNSAQTTGNSDYDIMREVFRSSGKKRVDFRVPKANPHVRDRVNVMNAKLKT